MSDLESQILGFIKSRQEKGESTAPRHIHIRFDIEIPTIERILQSLAEKNKIQEFFDSDYQENRFNLLFQAVKE